MLQLGPKRKHVDQILLFPFLLAHITQLEEVATDSTWVLAVVRVCVAECTVDRFVDSYSSQFRSAESSESTIYHFCELIVWYVGKEEKAYPESSSAKQYPAR